MTDRIKLILLVCGCGLLSGLCFLIISLLGPPKVAYFKDPLRGILTGLAVAGIGLPLHLTGQIIHCSSAQSPYFEGRFIAGFLSLVGYICLCVALVCLGLGVYALVVKSFGR